MLLTMMIRLDWIDKQTPKREREKKRETWPNKKRKCVAGGKRLAKLGERVGELEQLDTYPV